MLKTSEIYWRINDTKKTALIREKRLDAGWCCTNIMTLNGVENLAMDIEKKNFNIVYCGMPTMNDTGNSFHVHSVFFPTLCGKTNF